MSSGFLSCTGKECTLKGKHLLPWGANAFLLEWTPIQKRDKMILTELPPLSVLISLKDLFSVKKLVSCTI